MTTDPIEGDFIQALDSGELEPEPCAGCGLADPLPDDELCGACLDAWNAEMDAADGRWDPDDANDPGVPKWPD